MASIRVKFKPSVVEGKEGTLCYQVIHNRTVRQITTDYRLQPWEWEGGKVRASATDSRRLAGLRSLQEHVGWDLRRLSAIVRRLENGKQNFTADDVVREFRYRGDDQTLRGFMEQTIIRLQLMAKWRTAETYMSTLRSFQRFMGGKDVLLEELDSDLMQMYEAYLCRQGVVRNSTSFYMRILRAVYNRAVEKGLTPSANPFKHVYTGVDKTVKRALPLAMLRKIRNVELPLRSQLDFARDMFLFSFFTRGMSFVDMAFLRRDNLRDGVLSYRRRKTGQQLFIRWEKCMQEIVGKWADGVSGPYMLPIIKDAEGDIRRQYRNEQLRINRNLKEVAARAGLAVTLTLYCARHSWASVAKSKNVPVSVISEGLGHDSEMTTQIYLASLDNAVVDKANANILKDLVV